MLSLLETFLELLLWNTFQCHNCIILNVLSILISPTLWGRLYFWKQPEVIQSQIRGTGWVFHFSKRFLGQKLLDRESLVSCSTVMVKNPISGPKFRTLSMNSFMYLLQYFHIISLADWSCKMNWKWITFLISKKVRALPSFVISTCELFLNYLCYSKTHDLFIASPP